MSLFKFNIFKFSLIESLFSSIVSSLFVSFSVLNASRKLISIFGWYCLIFILFFKKFENFSVKPGLPVKWREQRALDLFKDVPIYLHNSSFNPVKLRSKCINFWLYLINLIRFFVNILYASFNAFYLFANSLSAIEGKYFIFGGPGTASSGFSGGYS